MAIVRKADLKAMDASGLKAKLQEIENSLASEFAGLKSSTRGKSIRYRELRKARARIKTILNQRGVKI